MAFVETGTILDRILARTAADLVERKRLVPFDELQRLAAARATPVPFRESLERTRMAVIAEFKRASPSKGRFPVELEPDVVARDYVSGGASAMSILTDEPFFQGSVSDMEPAAAVAHALASPVPVLRKDF